MKLLLLGALRKAWYGEPSSYCTLDQRDASAWQLLPQFSHLRNIPLSVACFVTAREVKPTYFKYGFNMKYYGEALVLWHTVNVYVNGGFLISEVEESSK